MKYILLLSVILISSCVFHKKATLLDELNYKKETQSYIDTILVPNIGEPNAASIGDVILSYTKINYSSEIVLANPPYPLTKLPRTGWANTHTYNSYQVYTHPEYYRGSIGAVLDKNENVILFLQTAGVKSGRRWRGSGRSFFGVASTIMEDWRLRYSGRNQSAYKFEIVNNREDKAIHATQAFEVSEESFVNGFAIRGVVIKGLKAREHGMISYQIVSNAR